MKTTIRRYREILVQRGEYEPGSVPSRDAIVRRIKRGELPGEQIGRTWYVIDRPPSGKVQRLVDEIVKGI